MRSTPLSFLVWALVFSSLLPLTAQAALYAPGETLDPACAPTDVNCGITAQVGTGTTGQVPYYAASGSVLTATSTVTILQNGNVGVGTTSPSSKFSVSGPSYLNGTLTLPGASFLNIGTAGWTGSGIGGIQFAAPLSETEGYVLGSGRGVWTDGGTGSPYVDHTFFLGLNPAQHVGTPTIGISLESKYRQSGTSAFASEFITTFTTPDNTITRRPWQWVGYHETVGGSTKGNISQAFTGRIEYYSSAGTQQMILTEGGTLQFAAGERSIAFGSSAALITAAGTDPNLSLNIQTGGHSSFGLTTQSGGATLQVLDNSGGTLNGYLQILPAWFNGYQRNVNLIAAGSISNVGLALRAKGTGAVAFETATEGNAQLFVTPTVSSVNPLTITGGTSGNGPTIGAAFASADTNVDINLAPKGSGKLSVASGVYISGTVGIGTTTPGSTLVVASSTATGTSGLLSVGTTSSSIFTVLANGNVGVGTTTPGQALSVAGNILSTGTFASGGTINFGNVPYALKLNVNGAIGSQAPVFTIGAIGNFPGVNVGAPAGQEDNTVAAIGWNLQVGNGRLDTSKPASGIVFENNYRQGGVQAFETHITMTDTSGLEHRAFTTFMPRDGGLGSGIAMQADTINLLDFSGVQKLKMNWPTGAMQVFSGSLWQYEVNNTPVAKQVNAAGNGYVLLPYVDSSDKLNLGVATVYTLANFGVGTTSPFGKIDSVNLGVPLSVFNTDQTAGFRELARFAGGSNADGSGGRVIFNDSASYADSRIRAASGWSRQAGVFGYDIFAGASLTQVARFESTGNVGIGSTSPFARLSVKGAGNTSGVNFQTTNSSNSPLFTILDSGSVGIGTTTPFGLLSINPIAGNTGPAFVIGSTTKTLFSVANTGDVTINGSSGSTCTIGNGTGGTSCTSDERLKTDIALIVNPLEGIQQLRGVTFKWSDRSKDQSQFIGVIAQDVQKVFPQAVTTTAGGYLSVDYASLVAPLIEAVKELAGKVSVLADTVAGFKQQFTTNKLCVGSTCVTEAELKMLLQNSGQQAAPAPSSESGPIIITDVPPVEPPNETASSTPSTPEEAFIPETPLSTGSSGSTTPSDAVSS